MPCSNLFTRFEHSDHSQKEVDRDYDITAVFLQPVEAGLLRGLHIRLVGHVGDEGGECKQCADYKAYTSDVSDLIGELCAMIGWGWGSQERKQRSEAIHAG